MCEGLAKAVSYVLGVDLGTTNTVVATVDGDAPRMLPNIEGALLTPSIVAYTPAGDVLVGASANAQRVTNVEHTIVSVKRFMGSRWTHDVAPHGVLTPEMVSARILLKAVTDAQMYLDAPVSGVVITVPAYFSDTQRAATRNAGVLAGLNVLNVVSEPTAAAVAYGLTVAKGAQSIIVCDIGGGTFDVSALRIDGTNMTVVATAGDNYLGGDDFDDLLAQFVAKRFLDTQQVDVTSDPGLYVRFRDAVQAAKQQLSTHTVTEVELPYARMSAQGPFHAHVTVTRDEFEAVSAPLMARCEAPFRQVLTDTGWTADDVDVVLLVGGATRMPMVHRMVNTLVGVAPVMPLNPDEAVAAGAALIASGYVEGVSRVSLSDVVPLSLGVETKGGVMTCLVPRNTAFPVSASQVFSTAQDNQSSVLIQVFQGERSIAKFNKKLATFELTDLAPAPAGVPQIEVTFAVDADGIVSVRAMDVRSAQVQNVSVSASTRLSDEQVNVMLAQAHVHAVEDQRLARLAVLRNRTENAVNAFNTFLGNSEALSPGDALAVSDMVTRLLVVLETDRPIDMVAVLVDAAALAHEHDIAWNDDALRSLQTVP